MTVFKRVCGRSHSAVMCSAGEVPKGQGCRRFPSLHHSSQWLQKFGRSSPARHPQVWFCVRYINSISQVYCVTIGVASRSVRMKAGFSWAIQAWTPKSNKGQILTNNNNCKVSWCVLHTHFLYNVSLQLLYSYISLPLESSVLSCLSLSLSLSCFLSFLVFCFLSPSLSLSPNLCNPMILLWLMYSAYTDAGSVGACAVPPSPSVALSSPKAEFTSQKRVVKTETLCILYIFAFHSCHISRHTSLRSLVASAHPLRSCWIIFA